jgi:hypothetical protein
LPEVIKLLVVEDEAQALTDWRNKLELYNADGEGHFEITAQYAASLQEVKALLPSRKFDAAVVDLRLRTGEVGAQHNAQGNEVVSLLASTELAAIAVYTGQPTEAAHPDSSPNVVVIEKVEGLDSVMTWLKAQSKLIFKMQKASAKIQTDMAVMFHRSIWPRWKYWLGNNGQDDNMLDVALTRHLVSHLYATLLDSTTGVHSEEWYFVPPIETRPISTGDLVLNAEGKVEIVITPRCDIAHADKSKTIQLAECEDVAKEWNQLSADAKTPTKAKQANSDISNWKQHKKKAVLHFMPGMVIDDKRRGPWFVRFDAIRSIEKSEQLLGQLKVQRFASITSEFLPSLVERLGNFFSRIGSPDLS